MNFRIHIVEGGLHRNGNWDVQVPDGATEYAVKAFCRIGETIRYADETTWMPGCPPIAARGRVVAKDVLLDKGEVWLTVEKEEY